MDSIHSNSIKNRFYLMYYFEIQKIFYERVFHFDFELYNKIIYITNTLNSINNSIYKIINISMNLENQIDSTVSMTDC